MSGANQRITPELFKGLLERVGTSYPSQMGIEPLEQALEEFGCDPLVGAAHGAAVSQCRSIGAGSALCGNGQRAQVARNEPTG